MTIHAGTPKGKQKPFRGVSKGRVSSYTRRGLPDPRETTLEMDFYANRLEYENGVVTQYYNVNQAEEDEYYNPSWKKPAKPIISRELPSTPTGKEIVKTSSQTPTTQRAKSPQVKLTKEQIASQENRDNIRSLSIKYHVPVHQVLSDIEKSPTAYFGKLTTGAPTYDYPPEVGKSNYERSLAETRAKIQGRMTGIMSWEKVESVRPMSGGEEWFRGDTKKFIMEQPRGFRESIMPSYENATKELDMLRNLGIENVSVDVENPEFTKLSYMGRRSDILAGSVTKIPIVSLVTDPIGDYIGYSDTIKAVGRAKEEGYKPVYPVTLLGQKVGDMDVGFISNSLTNPKSFESIYGEMYQAYGGEKNSVKNMTLGQYEAYLGGKIREEANFQKKMGEEELVATVGTSVLYAPFTAPSLVKVGSEAVGWIGAGVGGKVAGEQTYELTGSKELSLGASIAGSFIGARTAVKAYEGSPRLVFQKRGFAEWEGLAIEQGVFSKQIIGRDTSTGLITLGTPKNIVINAPLYTSVRTVWAETATEAKILKAQLSPVDAKMISAGNSFSLIYAKQKGKIYNDLPMETKTMTPRESKIFLNFAKQEKILLGGSTVMETGMPKTLGVKDSYYVNRPMEYGAGDWDGTFPYTTAKATQKIPELFNKLDAVSPNKFKMVGIGIKNVEKNAHAFDGHANDVVKSWYGDTSFTPEMRYGFVLPQKPTKISGIPVRTMNELRTRKTTAMFGVYKTDAGVLFIQPENVRMKDAPDAINMMRVTQMEAESSLGFGQLRALVSKSKLDFVMSEAKRRGWYTAKDVGQPIDMIVDFTETGVNRKAYDLAGTKSGYGGGVYPKNSIIGYNGGSGLISSQLGDVSRYGSFKATAYPQFVYPIYSPKYNKTSLKSNIRPTYTLKSRGTIPPSRYKLPQAPRSPVTKYTSIGGVKPYAFTSPKPKPITTSYKPHGYTSTMPKMSYGLNTNKKPKAVPILKDALNNRKLFKSLPLFRKTKGKQKNLRIDFDDYVQVMTGRKRKNKREFLDFRLFNTRPKKGRRII